MSTYNNEIFVEQDDVIKYSKSARSSLRLWNEEPADYIHKGISSSWDGSIDDDNLENAYIYHEVHELENYLESSMMGMAADIIYEQSYVPLPKDILNSYMDNYADGDIIEVSFEFPYGDFEYHKREQVIDCDYAIANVIVDENIEDRLSIKEIDEMHRFDI